MVCSLFLISALVCLCIWTTWVVVSHIVILFAHIFFFVRYSLYVHVHDAFHLFFYFSFSSLFFPFAFTSQRTNEMNKLIKTETTFQEFLSFDMKVNKRKEKKSPVLCEYAKMEWNCWTFEQFKCKDEGILVSCYICRNMKHYKQKRRHYAV